MRLILLVLPLIILSSCDLLKPDPEIASVPIIYLDFNGNSKSSGIENYRSLGNQKLSYKPGLKDSCLNLTITSPFRRPVILETKGDIMIDNQPYISVMVWVKMEKDDYETYGLIGNKNINDSNEKGWIISSTTEGSWKLEISDGNLHWEYQATAQSQKINDGYWHQIGFVVDKNEHVLETYFDGVQRGIVALQDFKNFASDYHLHIGCSPGSQDYSMDSFNGYIDEVGVWTKKLNHQNFKNAYLNIKKQKLTQIQEVDETFKVLTWNIWNGGKQRGKTVGLNQIANIIKDSKADIVAIQEDFGSGEYLADKLGFILYRSSTNLCLLSRFPIKKTYHIYRSLNSGSAEIQLNDEKSVIVCPLWLSYKPNIKGLLVNEAANTDTIIDIETKSRASEAKFILSELHKFNNASNQESIILAGDFNSGSHLDWTVKNAKQKYNKCIAFPVTVLMEQEGYKDSFREVWNDETKYPGNTYSPIFKDNYTDRIDFIFYKGNTIKAIDAIIIDSSPSFFPSDHAAVLVTFKLQ